MAPKITAEDLRKSFQEFFVETGAIDKTPDFLTETVKHADRGAVADRSEWAARTGRDGAE
jgi:hypothetical protein